MSYQPEVVSYDAGVYQLETTDPVDGGVGSVSNSPLLSLANRTAYLYQHVTNLENGTTIPPTVAPLNNANLTGSPTTPTPALGDSSTKISNTAFVQGTVNGLLSINVAGNANVALTSVQAGYGILVFTGALTGNIAVIVPSVTKSMVVENLTSGAFTLTVKTAAGTGVAVTQGKTQELICDGTNVLLSSSDFVNVALSGLPTAPTAAPGTNTSQVSTTAFVTAAVAAVASGYALLAGSAGQVFNVGPATSSANAVQLAQLQARGINASNIDIVGATGTLPATVAGGLVIINGVYNAGLPPSASVPPYSQITILSYANGAIVTPQTGDAFVLSSAGSSANVTLNNNDSLVLVSTGSGWYAVGGSIYERAALDNRYAALAGSSTQTFSVARGTAATHSAALSQVQNGSRVVGLVAQNNATTPLTKFDVSAFSVTLREPSTGIAYTVTTPAQVTLTNDTGLAGPIANGRDGAGALAASQWVRLFYIYNPTTATLATISSAGSPTAGPNLPPGYTAWAYIGSVYWNASSNFALGNMRGARFQYATSVVALNGGTSTGLVAVPVPTLVPPECGWFELFFQQLAITANGSNGSYSVNCQIVTQASSIFNIGLTGQGVASAIASISGPSKQITNFGQSFAYQLTPGAGVGPSVTIYVTGYQLPNGGD